MSTPSTQQAIKCWRSIDRSIEDRPVMKVKFDKAFLETFIADFTRRVEQRANDMDERPTVRTSHTGKAVETTY